MRPYRFEPPLDSAAAEAPVSGRRLWPGLAARTVAGVVAGSGVLNLVSVMGHRKIGTRWPEWIRDLFPLDFCGVSRSLTLLGGFLLILTAIHLCSGKRRAWQLAVVLVTASVLFHLTVAWNVEEAVCSAGIAALLWATRRWFCVGASRPRIADATFRVLIAFAIALLYGSAGFWLLSPAEFQHNFHWWEASARTVRYMLFLDDGTLIPRTSYAAWFLDSLFWISAASFMYSGFILFRPVVYRFRVDTQGSVRAEQIAREHGRTAQDYFKHSQDKSYSFSSSGQSFLGYRVARSYALVLGDPVGPQENLERTVREFLGFCQARGWRVGFHQVGSECLRVYESLGFRRMRVGDDAIVDVTRFSLAGSAMKEFRNTVNRLDRLGFRVERHESPLDSALLSELKLVSDRWLGMHGNRERQFTLGKFDRAYLRSTPVYVVRDPDGQAVAFVNLVPTYEPGCVAIDLMRRSTDSVNGLMDYLFAKVLLDLRERGILRFSLGMAPVSPLDEEPATSLDEQAVRWAMKKMPSVFRSDSLRRFKAKYAHAWMPRYAVYQSRLDLPRLALALRDITELPERLRGAA